MKVPLFFPIEVSKREWDARLLLAAKCVDANSVAYVGRDRDVLYLAQRSQGGVLIGKQILVGGRQPRFSKYQSLRDRSIACLFLAEEEPFFGPPEKMDEEQYLQMFHPDWLANDDLLCSWGEYSAGIFRKASPDKSERIIVTGHPRFDLCKAVFSNIYAAQTRELKERFGRFLILNTKFALANNLPAFRGVARDFSARISGEQKDDYWLEYHCYHTRLQTAYIELANELRKAFPDHQIILRPHPGEGAEWYRAALTGIAGVHVLTEGGVLPWLAAAEALVHTGCSTGLEAYGLTRTIIHYAPEDEGNFQQDLPSLVGQVCRSPSEVIDLLLSPDKATVIEPANLQRITSVIGNYANATHSIDRISSLVKIAIQEQDEGIPPAKIYETEAAARSAWNRLRQRLRGKMRREKFDPIDQNQTRAKISVIAQILGKTIQCEFLSKSMIKLTSN